MSDAKFKKGGGGTENKDRYPSAVDYRDRRSVHTQNNDCPLAHKATRSTTPPQKSQLETSNGVTDIHQF